MHLVKQFVPAGIFFVKKYFLMTYVAGAYSFSITKKFHAPKRKSGTPMTDIGVSKNIF